MLTSRSAAFHSVFCTSVHVARFASTSIPGSRVPDLRASPPCRKLASRVAEHPRCRSGSPPTSPRRRAPPHLPSWHPRRHPPGSPAPPPPSRATGPPCAPDDDLGDGPPRTLRRAPERQARPHLAAWQAATSRRVIVDALSRHSLPLRPLMRIAGASQRTAHCPLREILSTRLHLSAGSHRSSSSPAKC